MRFAYYSREYINLKMDYYNQLWCACFEQLLKLSVSKKIFGYVQKAGKMIVHKMFDNGAKRLLLKLA